METTNKSIDFDGDPRELLPLYEIPYYRSSSSAQKTEEQIGRLFAKYNITNYRWTTAGEDKLLEFILEHKPPDQSLNIRIPLPRIYARQGGKVILVPALQRLRMFYAYLKTSLEATQFGLMKLEQIFFGFIRLQLPDGTEMSTSDLLAHYQDGTLLLKAPP